MAVSFALIAPQPRFDGTKAFRLLQQQCQFGPRNPGSSGHRKCRDWILETTSGLADTVLAQDFSYADPYTGRSLPLTNVIARFRPDARQRIWLAAHWDTRPWADRDPDPRNRSKPIPGANDGASGVAVLLELARVLKDFPPQIGVDLVFLDGEDLGRSGDTERYFVGSRHLARNPIAPLPDYCIVIDMVGDKRLRIPMEGYSIRQAPEVMDLLWDQAEALGLAQFVREVGSAVEDDHVILHHLGGIRAVDLIDFDYSAGLRSFWHTMDDTPPHCSAQSLSAVGALLLHHVRSLAP